MAGIWRRPEHFRPEHDGKATTVIYVIIPFEQGKGFLSKLETLDISVCDVEAPAAYFVSFNGTTRKLSEAIGYGDDEGVGSGIVIPVSNYFGYASAELWEWLEIHQNGN